MDDRQVGLAMAKMGGNGGGVMKSPPPGVSSSNIQGSFASWSQPISTWASSGVTPTYGHVAYDLTTSGSPVSEWLNRYDTGNPEANRMHTNIDMNNNSLNNTYAVNGDGNSDIQMGNSSHTGRVDMYNGGIACQGNATGCHFDISDDGGFYDQNDGWITYQGNNPGTGLKIKNDNLDVQGKTVTENGVVTSDVAGIQWSANPATTGTVEASATYAGGWINIAGGSGFQGVSTQIVQATELLDKNNNAYYVIPSGLSHLNEAQFAGNIATNGLSPDNGLPAGWNGVHTFDLYSEDKIGTGSGGTILSYMDKTGHIEGVTEHLSSTLDVDKKVTENDNVEMTDGYLMLDNGDEWINHGNLVVNQGGSGSGSAWIQDSLTVGKNPQGDYGDHQG
ncbi:shufflon system plasmid conjugative transfer pilus tip adhesin PilV [Acetobacter sp. AAB5]|uniref:shufflon system plasmid conjugative transfer pilus tip adhesin PilV n=1 Tax=Acetobacter sp. AAB5 TaxID=3418370 RepID=UPI003CF4D92F